MIESSDSVAGQKMKVVIIGGGVGGMSLAMELTRKNTGIDITVIKKENLGSYSPCGMPFVLEGEIERMEDIILNTPDFYIEKDISLKTGCEVTDIDLKNKSVKLDSGENINYDKLVIATGRKPFIPPIKGVDLEGVFTLSNYDDGIRVFKAAKNVKQAVIIGAGIIGLETACAFIKHNIKSTVIEMLPSIVPQILDQDMASILQDRLINMGIEIFTSSKVSSIEGKEKVESVVMDDKKIEADFVLVATGVRPNSDLANKTGLALGNSKGIITDPKLNVEKDGRTLENVYALGDCVEVKNKIINAHQISAMASTAVLQARVVGENICGGNAIIKGYLSPTITLISGLQVGSVGLTSHTAKRSGLDFKISKASGPTRASYFPRRKEIQIKLLAHDDKLIGAQMISEEDVKERVNALTLAILNEMTIDDLLYTERCFTPPLSMLTDPLIRALENF